MINSWRGSRGLPGVSSAVALLLLSGQALLAQAPPCFAVETLDARTRASAEALLLATGDGEGLYTLAGGLKPVSSDFARVTITVTPDTDRVALDSLATLQAATQALRCGPITFVMLEFAETYTRPDSTRYRMAAGYVVHREALARAIARHADFWRALGVTPDLAPAAVLAAVEHAPRAERWRGYGYLFGYPDEAVDFFVSAGEMQDSTGVFVRRDFRRIETFRKFGGGDGDSAPLSSFVYAVPLGAPESDADRALRSSAAPLYARYVVERERHRVGDRIDAVALWRSWVLDLMRPPSDP